MEGLAVVELRCSASSDDVRGLLSAHSCKFINLIQKLPSTQTERDPADMKKPTIIGLYPPSFQHGRSVPANMQLFCFPDDEVLVKKMQRFPLAAISSSCTGCVKSIW